jgi:hypothetical protein
LLTACCDRGGVGSLRSDDITVPGVARDVLRARLTGLAPKTCEALEVACVIGQEFELPVLQDALGIGFESLLVQLDEAARAPLLAPAPMVSRTTRSAKLSTRSCRPLDGSSSTAASRTRSRDGQSETSA